MSLPLYKLAFCISASVISTIAYYYLDKKRFGEKIYIPLIIIGYVVKISAAIVIYSSNLPFDLTSDAVNYYLPQSLDFLSGKIPYRDFSSSYSFLFFPLISLSLIICKSIGSIIVTMTLLDMITVAVYVYFYRKINRKHSLSVAFLYTFNPISLYWISIVGHNGVIISLGIIAGLTLAHYKKNLLSGSSVALGFLCCKLLGVMFWPAIIFFSNSGRLKRMIPMAVAIGLPITIMLIGINSLLPVVNEFGNYTSGNIWFVFSRFNSGFLGSFAWNVLPLLVFAIMYLYTFRIYITENHQSAFNTFDFTAIFIVLTNLIFLLFSKKSNTFYLTMTLLLLIHILLLDPKRIWWKLISLCYVSSVTTIEMFLWHDPTFSENVLSSVRGLIFITMELLLLGCYILWIIECLRLMKDRKDNSPINSMIIVEQTQQIPFKTITTKI